MNYIISQIIFAIGYLVLATSFLCKTKQKTLTLVILADYILLIGYLVLGRFAVVPMVAITMIRVIIFYFLEKFNIKSIFFLILMEILTIFSCLYQFELFSLILLVGYIFYTYGCWQSKKFILYVCNIILSVSIIVYNSLISNLMPCIMESVFIILTTIITIRDFIYKKNGKYKGY